MIRRLTERAYFGICLTLGRLLRSARYSNAAIVGQGGEREVRKHRAFYAPLLIWMSVPVIRILNTGVWVLPRRAWVERERAIYQRLGRGPIRIADDGALVLPYVAGSTLARLLEDAALEEPRRNDAIERAVRALAELHQLGFTHADAMAENVLVDLDGAAAQWIDFETIHESRRPIIWRQADDLRALLMTCLVRTRPEKIARTLRLILDGYADENVAREMAASVASVFRRSLAFELAQAGLSFERYGAIARLLSARPSRV